MDDQSSRIAVLEDEVKALRDEKERLRQLVIEAEVRAEGEAEKRRSACLELENRYEGERSKRIKLELAFADGRSARTQNIMSASNPQSSSTANMNTLRLSATSGPAMPDILTISSSAEHQPDLVDLQAPPKSAKPNSVETKVTVKLSPSSSRKPKIESVTTDNKRKRITSKDDEEEKQGSLSFDQPSARRQRRPVRESSRLPVTIAERQAISTASDPSHLAAAATHQTKKTPSKTRGGQATRQGLLEPSASPGPPASHSNEDPVRNTISPASDVRSSSSKVLVFSPPRQIIPLEPLPSPTASVFDEHDAPPSPIIRRPKPYILVPNDRKGKGKAKVDGARFTIDRLEVSMYLADAFAFPIDPPPLSVQVSRKALSDEYGLPGMGFLWKSKHKNRPLKFLMPTIGLNPELPGSPGAPGLLLTCREELLKDGPWTLFIKAPGSKKVRLNYAGEYVCEKIGTMTKEEFAEQDQAVKIEWGQKIAKHKKFAVYRDLRARITLRKRLGAEPTDQQISKESSLISTKNYLSSLSDADVVESFERGDEHIGVIRLECLTYDHERAEGFIQAQAKCERREREEANLPPNERKRKRKTQEEPKPRKKKVERVVSSEPEDESDELAESGDESEN